MESYLTNRFFFIDYLKDFSNLYQVQSGVPQEGVLAVLLFLLCMSDIPTQSDSFLATFADLKVIAKRLQDHLNKRLTHK